MKINLMRGTGRADGNLHGSDIGLVFATTNRQTALKYGSWGEHGNIIHFSIDDEGVANLNDEDTARKIVNYINDYLDKDGVDVEEYVRQLIDNETEGEIGIMDDWSFSRAVASLGYVGAKQGEDYALMEGEVVFSVLSVEEM